MFTEKGPRQQRGQGGSGQAQNGSTAGAEAFDGLAHEPHGDDGGTRRHHRGAGPDARGLREQGQAMRAERMDTARHAGAAQAPGHGAQAAELADQDFCVEQKEPQNKPTSDAVGFSSWQGDSAIGIAELHEE